MAVEDAGSSKELSEDDRNGRRDCSKVYGGCPYVVSAQQSLSQNHEQLWIPAERGYAASNSMKWMESDPLSLSAK